MPLPLLMMPHSGCPVHPLSVFASRLADPWLARDLATAAARNPKTTWCVTVTDEQGHAVGHGCARPEPKRHRKRAGPAPPGGARDGPGFAFAPDPGRGTWRLRIPGDGPDLLVTLDPITTQECDHRFQARGHDPGVKLRHLTQVRLRDLHRDRAAGDPPPAATSSTTPRTKRADGRACATAVRNVGAITGSSRTPAGRSTSFPTGRSGGPPRPGGSTPPNQRGTRFRETGTRALPR